MLIVVFIGNFVGEEVYFCGYLLHKISGLSVGGFPIHWLVGSVLFQAYHVWQLPVNLAFIGLAPIIPMTILVVLRRSVYGAVLFHAFFNLFYFAALYALFGIGPGE